MSLVKNAKINNRGRVVYTTKPEMGLYDSFIKHQKMAKCILQEEYNNKFVITKIIVDDNLNVVQEFYGTTGHSPMIEMTKPDTSFYDNRLLITSEDKIGKPENKGYRVECGYIDGKALEYTYFPNVIQVRCSDNDILRKMTQEGFSYKAEEKIVFKDNSSLEGWTYLPGVSVWGPSNEKMANKFFFANCTNKDMWKKLDDLNGGGYDYYLNQDNLKGKSILKQASRLNLFGTTMTKLAKIDLNKDYIVYVDCSMDASCDTTDKDTERLLKHGMDFGKNINDGKMYLSAEAIAEGKGITIEEALSISPQTRATVLNTKTLSETFMANDLETLTNKSLKLLYGDKVYLYGNTSGKCMMIVDKDGAKLPNFKSLEKRDREITVYTLAVAKASNSRTSSQMMIKPLLKNYDKGSKRICELMVEAINEQFLGNADGSFNPFTGFRAATQAVLGDKIGQDESHLFNVLHDTANFTKSAIADLKVSLNSVYNHAMFDDTFIQTGGNIYHTLGIRDTKKYGQLVEVYSKDVCVYFEKEIKDIEMSAMTDKDKEIALDDLLSAFVIKYPSAGSEEYLGVRYLTQAEWKEKVNNNITHMKIVGVDEELIEVYERYAQNISFGVTIFASFNFVKNKLAGMDVDFDATLAVFDKLKEVVLDGSNILTYIDYADMNEAEYNYGAKKSLNLNFSK